MNENIITQEEFLAVKEFHFLFIAYMETDTEEKMLRLESEIILDPNWIKVVKSGARAWQQLKSIIKDTEEITYMIELEKYYLSNNIER